jgi:FhaA, N-terminal domain/FHA domain
VPILRDFERRLGSMVEGFFATTFRSGLQPVELAKRLLREMDDAKTVGVHEVWAPNHFVFSLSPEDAERFEQAEQALVSELKQVVREAAAERGWGLVGPPEVEFQVDRSLSRGRFRCEASLVEGEAEPAGAGTAAGGGTASGSLTVLEDGHPGRTYRLGRASVTIGRLPECDIVIADPGASRQHAQVRFDGERFVLADLGSTNGTLVNDVPASERALEDGDRVTIGSTVLEFRAG